MAQANANGNLAGDDGTTPQMSWKKNLRALKVEASSTCRLLGQAYFTAYGDRTAVVDRGEAALDLIYRGCTFDLIMIGMHLHDMNGAQCARWLRTIGVESKLLGMSSSYRDGQQQEFLEAGGNGFIQIPFHPDNFVPILKELAG